MIRVVKWKEEQCHLGDLLPTNFHVGIGKFCFFISIYRGGLSFHLHFDNLYEIQFISKKKRNDLVSFGYKEVTYYEYFK